MVDMNNTIDKLYLADMYRTFYFKPSEYTFHSSVHGRFLRPYVRPKTMSWKIKNFEIIPTISSYHIGIKLEIIISKRKTGNSIIHRNKAMVSRMTNGSKQTLKGK